jgi:heme/copper-type cytochrome/quinol oxidase subunit 2
MAYIVALSAGWVTYSWFRAGQDHFSHGSRTLAIVWTIVFTILVVGAAIRTWHDRKL